jgi:F420-non-reducing hydrogenase iron-sulfur subunit
MADFLDRGQQNPPGQGGLPPASQKALKDATITDTASREAVETQRKKDEFQPRVAAICCNWCTWSSLDEAGVAGHKFPAEVAVIRTLCSARIEPRNVINMFREGLDGVFVGACDKGSCHYLSGTNLAQKELGQLMEVLTSPSIGFKGRLKIGFFVGREGPLFARALTEFVEDVRRVGPSPLNTNPTYRGREAQKPAEAAKPAGKDEKRLVEVEDV